MTPGQQFTVELLKQANQFVQTCGDSITHTLQLVLPVLCTLIPPGLVKEFFERKSNKNGP